MWRSIATRASISKRAITDLCPNRNHHPQVLYKTLNSNNPTSPHVFNNEHPLTFLCQTHVRFWSQSSIDHREFDPPYDNHPPHHVPILTVSSDSLEFGAEDTHFGETEPTRVSDSLGIEEQEPVGNEPAHVGNFLYGNGLVEEDRYEVDVEKLEAVLSLLQSTVDGSLESTLDGMDLRLHEEFVVRVLETPAVPGQHLIRFFKWAMAKDEVAVTPLMLDAVVRAVGNDLSKKDVYALWDVIKEMGEKEKSAVNAEVLNGLISLLSKLSKAKASLEVFDKFEEFGCVPDGDTYYLTIGALCRRTFYDSASLVCERMLNAGCLPESEKIWDMILLFCKGSKAKEAFSIYLSAKENSRYPPQDAMNHLIATLSKVDEMVNFALKMLDDFSGEARRSAILSFRDVIGGLCRIKDMDGARNLLSRMIEDGPPPTNSVFNLIITSLSKAGELDEAMRMLRLMESRGLKPSVYTYSVMMSGYSKAGLMDEACKVLSEAKEKHSKLCPVTYHTLIRGYCKLKEYDKALQLFSEMEDHGVKPSVDECNKMIQSLCLEALDWKKAEELLDVMRQKGLYLPSMTRGLIQAVKELEGEALGSIVVSPGV